MRAGRKHAYPSSRRVPAGYSSIGLLASIARLRFTGNRRLTCSPNRPRPEVEWAPFLRQPVKARFSLNGESHERVSKKFHKRVQGGRRAAAGIGGLVGRRGASLRGQSKRFASL